MTETLYKWLNGREAPVADGFRYRLRAWTPEIKGELIPCHNGYHLMRVKHLSRWCTCDLFVAEYDGDFLDAGDKVVVRRARIVEHLKGWNERAARLFAADCAEQVLPLFEKHRPNDDRPRLAIQAARDYADGLIGAAAQDAAWAAARDAARDAAQDTAGSAAGSAAASAAQDAAWVAAQDAAGSAAASAAGVAAWAAARDAAGDAAGVVAWDAAGTWQGQRILEYATGKLS